MCQLLYLSVGFSPVQFTVHQTAFIPTIGWALTFLYTYNLKNYNLNKKIKYIIPQLLFSRKAPKTVNPGI